MATPITREPLHHFFGYYDKCPWSGSEKYMLVLEVDFMDRPPSPNDIVKIGLIDLRDYRLNIIGTSKAWNWQQGCMAQWLPPKLDERIVYNDRLGNRFVSIILDIEKNERRILPLPIYCVSHDGRYGLSLNFARLDHTRPGYGYKGVPDPYRNVPAPKEDGIFLMDLDSGEYELIISLAEIASYRHTSSMDNAIHWFNHLLFNPSDSRFVFLHRWSRSRGGEHWYTRMFTSDRDGSEIYCVTDHEYVSHFDWRDSDHILAWARRYGLGDHYYLFKDREDEVEIVGKGVLTENGHCSYSPDRKWILTDTYPDERGFQKIILYNVEKNFRIDLGEFYSLPNLRGEIRCDLHPRWSRDGRKICFDSTHEGSRQMYVINIEKILSQY